MGIWGKTEMGNWVVVVLVIVMVARTTRVAEGQDSTPSCASALVPCSDYLNSTKPPASCCTPLRQTVATQLKCLCDLLKDTSLFESLKINITEAIGLSKHCGITDTTTACQKFSAPPPSASESTTPPPGVSGNGVEKLAWNVMPCWLVLLVVMVVIRDICVF